MTKESVLSRIRELASDEADRLEELDLHYSFGILSEDRLKEMRVYGNALDIMEKWNESEWKAYFKKRAAKRRSK